jgi:hypothetical protein
MTRKLHTLGVLLVHGIGEQPRGDTLLAFGEPLIESLRQWVGGRELGSVDVMESKLGTAQLEPGEPAHAVLGLSLAGRPKATWLLAESWWADEFRRPPFMKLAGWLLTIGPWAIISHASRWLWLGNAPKAQRPYQLLKIVAAVPLSWLMQIAVALLTVLAWLPVPALRRAVSGFLLRLTGTLGDSYVLLESPVQNAAARRALHRNIDWLAGRCDTVIVVAHSQGAALARLALAERTHPKVHLLVTFGSGVAKLEELEERSTGRLARTVQAILAVSLLGVALLPRALSQMEDDDLRSLVWTAFFMMPVALVLAAMTVVRRALEDWPTRAAALSLAPLDWIDYWATSDPVPNGPLARDGVVDRLQSVKLTNRISWLSDHSSYWENRDEFVLPLLVELDRRADAGLFVDGRPGPIPSIPGRRARVAVLAAARAVTGLMAAPLALFAFREQLAVFGQEAILRPLADRPLTRPVSELLTGLGSLAGAVIGPLVDWDAASLDHLGHLALGALIPIGLAAGWYRFCVLPAWTSWDRQCVEWLCRPAGIPRHPVDRFTRLILVVVAGLVPLALSVRALFRSDAGALAGEALDTLILMPFVGMALGLVLAFVILIVSASLAAVRWIRGLATRLRSPE